MANGNGKRPNTTGEHIVALYGHMTGIKRELHTIKDNHLKHLHDDLMRIQDKMDKFMYALVGFLVTLIVTLYIHFS
jgi:mannose/fructose/N-acetylgalactosamine-specific phosphotransferase system component IID